MICSKFFTAISLLSVLSLEVTAGSYIFAGDEGDEAIIAHPAGYTGSGGRITLTVCINPSSVSSVELLLEQPVKNIVETWNQLNPVTGNLLSFGNNNIPGNNDYDWESVALHEVGHCIGLGHPNLGSQTGVSGGNTEYTASTTGVDGVFDFNDGADNIIGSRDDLRDDDQTLFWFNDNINNPFVLSPPFDQTNYTRNVNDLPGSHNYPANPARAVGAALGFPATEAVMQQGTFNDEDQRRLGVDDVAAIRFAMSGVDQIANTGDDYTYRLVYDGIKSGCDVNILHDAGTGFGVCTVSGNFIGSNHIRISAANITIGVNSVDWFYNQEKNDLIYKDGHEY